MRSVTLLVTTASVRFTVSSTGSSSAFGVLAGWRDYGVPCSSGPAYTPFNELSDASSRSNLRRHYAFVDSRCRSLDCERFLSMRSGIVEL
jgi:hypothetical protein